MSTNQLVSTCIYCAWIYSWFFILDSCLCVIDDEPGHIIPVCRGEFGYPCYCYTHYNNTCKVWVSYGGEGEIRDRGRGKVVIHWSGVYEQHCLPKLAILLISWCIFIFTYKWVFFHLPDWNIYWHVWVLLWMLLLFFLSACIQVMLAMEWHVQLTLTMMAILTYPLTHAMLQPATRNTAFK